MAATTPNPQKIFASRQQVTAALQRAAEKARLIAAQTGTKLIVVVPAPMSTSPEAKPQ